MFFCLISSLVSCCVCYFLWFDFSFFHAIPATDTSCRSLFLFIVLLHISFHAYLFIQKDLGRYGPNNVNWIRRVLCPIYLDLSKPFWWRTVLCGRFVICCRSAFCCRSFSLALLSLDLSCSSVFFVGLWALLFIRLSFVWAFGYEFKKWASTISKSQENKTKIINFNWRYFDGLGKVI